MDPHIGFILKTSKVQTWSRSQSIQEDPEFDWWVSKVLRHRNIIISKVNSKYSRVTQKFGIRLPKTVEKKLRIENESWKEYWEKALNKEMSKVKVSWQRVDQITLNQARSGEVKELMGHQEINSHIIFDAGMGL